MTEEPTGSEPRDESGASSGGGADYARAGDWVGAQHETPEENRESADETKSDDATHSARSGGARYRGFGDDAWQFLRDAGLDERLRDSVEKLRERSRSAVGDAARWHTPNNVADRLADLLTGHAPGGRRPRRLLDAESAAYYLSGLEPGKGTPVVTAEDLLAEAAAGRLAHHRIGERVLFTPADLDAFLAATRVPGSDATHGGATPD